MTTNLFARTNLLLSGCSMSVISIRVDHEDNQFHDEVPPISTLLLF